MKSSMKNAIFLSVLLFSVLAKENPDKIFKNVKDGVGNSEKSNENCVNDLVEANSIVAQIGKSQKEILKKLDGIKSKLTNETFCHNFKTILECDKIDDWRVDVENYEDSIAKSQDNINLLKMETENIKIELDNFERELNQTVAINTPIMNKFDKDIFLLRKVIEMIKTTFQINATSSDEEEANEAKNENAINQTAKNVTSPSQTPAVNPSNQTNNTNQTNASNSKKVNLTNTTAFSFLSSGNLLKNFFTTEGKFNSINMAQVSAMLLDPKEFISTKKEGQKKNIEKGKMLLNYLRDFLYTLIGKKKEKELDITIKKDQLDLYSHENAYKLFDNLNEIDKENDIIEENTKNMTNLNEKIEMCINFDEDQCLNKLNNDRMMIDFLEREKNMTDSMINTFQIFNQTNMTLNDNED